jgi:hypothetical protein
MSTANAVTLMMHDTLNCVGVTVWKHVIFVYFGVTLLMRVNENISLSIS